MPYDPYNTANICNTHPPDSPGNDRNLPVRFSTSHTPSQSDWIWPPFLRVHLAMHSRFCPDVNRRRISCTPCESRDLSTPAGRPAHHSSFLMLLNLNTWLKKIQTHTYPAKKPLDQLPTGSGEQVANDDQFLHFLGDNLYHCFLVNSQLYTRWPRSRLNPGLWLVEPRWIPASPLWRSQKAREKPHRMTSSTSKWLTASLRLGSIAAAAATTGATLALDNMTHCYDMAEGVDTFVKWKRA